MRSHKHLPVAVVFDEMPTPVGILKIIAAETGLYAILWEHEAIAPIPRSEAHPIIVATKRQLSEYFAGTRTHFDLPLLPTGTPFQRQVWQALSDIPYGHTISYGEQAKRIGDKKKARAVGMANGQNPIPIIIPCHRVIGGNGKLTGFGGGLDNKAWLLTHEQKILHDI